MLNTTDKSIELYTQPQKITFKLGGGLSGEYPLDLRATSAFLIFFHHLIDKSYCVVSNTSRISSNDRKNYRLVAKSLEVGSLSAELMLIIEGISLALPLVGLANPKTIWDYTCLALDFAKQYFFDLSQNKHPHIEVNGNNNTIIYQCENTTKEYPEAIYDIANNSIPVYRKLAKTLNQGNFSSFLASSNSNNVPDISFDLDSEELFNEKSTIQPESNFKVNIISFNKETLSGKLQIIGSSNYRTDQTIPFKLLGDQSPTPYITAMATKMVNVRGSMEVIYSSLTPKIKCLHIASLVDENSI